MQLPAWPALNFHTCIIFLYCNVLLSSFSRKKPNYFTQFSLWSAHILIYSNSSHIHYWALLSFPPFCNPIPTWPFSSSVSTFLLVLGPCFCPSGFSLLSCPVHPVQQEVQFQGNCAILGEVLPSPAEPQEI